MGTFATNLIAIRTSRGLSQAKLAKISGVSQAMISMIESGERSPTESTMNMLAKSLNVPISVLVSEDSQNEKKPAEISGARERLVNLLVSVPEDQAQEVADLVAAFLSVRKRQ